MKRLKYILIFCLLCLADIALAQVRVTINAPHQAFVGQRIQVSYTVNTQDVDDYSINDFSGFDVLYGPSTSRQSSYSIINGKTNSSSTLTFSYTLMPTKEGTYKLPAMTVQSGGKKYASNSASVQVLPGDDKSASNGQQAGSQRSMRTQNAGEQISGKDLFVTVTASKTKVYEQEAVLLTYKLYTLVSIDQCSGKMPELDGFHVQEIELPQQKSLKYEVHNGRNYGTVVWSQYVLFPQKTGRLTVPALPFDVEVVQQDRNVDPFDAFFGGGSTLMRVQKRITAPAVNLDVRALPAKPVSYTGAVGSNFTINGTLNPQQVDANDAAQLRLEIKGTGNLKLMTAPQVNWSKDFEVYDPKMTEKTKLTTEGASGSMVFTYTVVPRHGGKFVVPPVEFTYFDTKTDSYKTLRTDSFLLSVANTKGFVSNHANREDVKVLNSDIRYIMTGGRGTHQTGSRFFASRFYFALYPLAIFTVLVIGFVRYLNQKSDGSKKRGRRAGKAAAKRLKEAAKLMKQGEREAFYDEIMRALWGYVADKLSLPVSGLSKDNVRQLLLERNVADTDIQCFLDVLSDSEFARFAPQAAGVTMQQTMDNAVDVINTLDTIL